MESKLTSMKITAIQGTTGIVATGSGIAISTLQSVEIWFRLTSLGIGIVIGTITLIVMVRKLIKEW